MSGTLYLVATPIGNLQDISVRAIETLRTADLIACEDTRHTRKLLAAHGISNRLVSYHEHNEAERSCELVKLLADGSSIAVVSDAGTPAINDPGHRLVQKAIEFGATVIPIPGPVAFVSAAIVSGLPPVPVYFGGFLPSRSGERRRAVDALRHIRATLIFYESPHRLARSLADCAAILGPRQAAVVREMTKVHEEIIRGDLETLAEQYLSAKPKGEFVLVIAGSTGDERKIETSSLYELVTGYEASGVDRKAALKRAARELGLTRSEAYRQLQSRTGKK